MFAVRTHQIVLYHKIYAKVSECSKMEEKKTRTIITSPTYILRSAVRRVERVWSLRFSPFAAEAARVSVCVLVCVFVAYA